MKKLNKYKIGIIFAAASVISLSSCIDETFPTENATTEQVGESESAVEGLLNGIPATLQKNIFSSRQDWDYGYASIMHIRDVMTQDLATADPQSYNQYGYWGANRLQGTGYVFAQYLWTFQTKCINTTNSLIRAVDPTTASDKLKGYLGVAYAYRAMYYLDMAREYEYLPTDGTSGVNSDGNKVDSLTVPIVDENTTQEQARNNPRADRKTMASFILGDLQKAEEYIPYLTLSNKSMPHLDCVYGLYARLYMWIGDYANAEKYAKLAIDNSSTQPMTESAALSVTTGFNDLSQWMWGIQITKETMVSNLQNWISFASCETTWGYTGPGGGCNIMLDRNMYERLSNTDWRKLMWKAPAGSALDGKNTYCDASVGAALEDYASLKFRPAGGNVSDFSVGGEAAYPLMRVEEMYFIQAEAAAHLDEARGKELLESFMKNYRDPQYKCTASSKDALIEEIAFQKRIELWGEGQAFFDIKRLDLPCTRGYTGTNHLPTETFNTEGRAAWMNWVIEGYEDTGNAGVYLHNNPDPSDCYTRWSSAGE